MILSPDAKYLSIDPGDTTGWATFDAEGKTLHHGQVKEEDFHKFLDKMITDQLEIVIVEDYKVLGHKAKAHTGSKLKTSQKIGKIELTVDLRGTKMFLQPASIKKIGYMWAGLGSAPTNHSISHQFDALAHGVYYLVRNGILKPSLG